jgi:glucosamine--fructose-6-phosphate aminotransferase (isomerizing)
VRGSSDHAATYAKYMIETLLGVPTASAAFSGLAL